MLRDMLAPGGLLFLTLPLSCLTPPLPPPSHSSATTARVAAAAARAAPGFDRAVFEALLTSPPLNFVLLGPPDSKVSEKVAFYCLQRPEGAQAPPRATTPGDAGIGGRAGRESDGKQRPGKVATKKGFCIALPRLPS